jgi:hypothetical protein
MYLYWSIHANPEIFVRNGVTDEELAEIDGTVMLYSYFQPSPDSKPLEG